MESRRPPPTPSFPPSSVEGMHASLRRSKPAGASVKEPMAFPAGTSTCGGGCVRVCVYAGRPSPDHYDACGQTIHALNNTADPQQEASASATSCTKNIV